MKTLTEKTLIPISLVITLIGGVAWLSTVWAQGQSNKKDIAEIKKDGDVIRLKLEDIAEDVSYIRGKLEGK